MLSPFDRPAIQTATLICFLFLVAGHTATASAQKAVNDRPRIGLALSGGGARGAAHIGVLRVLERERIPIDYIAGTSMGSIVGGMYAAGMSLEEIESQLLAVDWNDVFDDKIDREDRSFRRKTDDRLWLIDRKPGFSDGKLKLPTGLVQGQKINSLLSALTLPVADIDDFDVLAIPYRAVAADIQTGETVVLGSGNLPKAINASMSVPAIMAPVPWGDRMLVDGGIASNLPIRVVRDMGSEIVIAVDIGTPLSEDDVAQSLLSIAEQLSGFLTRRNVNAEIATLTEQDILITPDLGDIESGDFDRIAEAVPTGFEAAEAALARLRAYALDEEAYAAHVAARVLPSGEVPVIEFVHFDNESRISDEFLRGRLGVSKLDQPLDVEVLEKAIDELYGLDIFSVVAYEIVQEDGKHGLWIRALPKSWGPDYLQLGIKWNTSFNGEGNFNFSAGLLKTELNSWNGEWRTVVAMGEEPGIITDFYQPLGTQAAWFAGAQAGFNQFNVNEFSVDSADIEEQFRIQRFAVTAYAGREFGTWGQGSLRYTRGTGNREIRIGDPTTPDEDFDIGELSLKLEVDELDNLYFPHHGHIAAATYRINRTGLGSSEDYDQALFNAGIARTRGKNTIQLGIDYRTTTSGVAPPERQFRAGGLFNVSGFEFNQLSGQHYGQVIGIYRRELSHIGFAHLSVGTSLEYGNVWENRSDIDFGDGLLAGSLFLGADTGIGPVYLGYGMAEGGNSSFYLYVGALRNDPVLQ